MVVLCHMMIISTEIELGKKRKHIPNNENITQTDKVRESKNVKGKI